MPRRWSLLLWMLVLALPQWVRAAPPLATDAGGGAAFSGVQVKDMDSGWEVRGHLRLAPEALPQPDPGRLRLEVRDTDGHLLASADAPLYRVVTADRRSRLYGFRGAVLGSFPADASLSLRRVPGSR